MEDQLAELAEKEYLRACKALESGNGMAALLLLEAALRHHDNPQWHSMLGYCVAREQGQVARGMELCRSSLQSFPDNPQHYYYYARLLLMSERKEEAIEMLRQGVIQGDSAAIRGLLQEIGPRKPLLFTRLHRDNPLNKYPGMLLARLGLR